MFAVVVLLVCATKPMSDAVARWFETTPTSAAELLGVEFPPVAADVVGDEVSIDLRGVTLSEALAAIGERVGVAIELDPDFARQVGFDSRKHIDVRVADTPAYEAVEVAAATAADWGSSIRPGEREAPIIAVDKDGGVTVTTRDRYQSLAHTMRYDVSRLLRDYYVRVDARPEPWWHKAKVWSHERLYQWGIVPTSPYGAMTLGLFAARRSPWPHLSPEIADYMLMQAISDSIEPDGWLVNGGLYFELSLHGKTLEVTATDEVHRMIGDLLFGLWQMWQEGWAGGTVLVTRPGSARDWAGVHEVQMPDGPMALGDALADVSGQAGLVLPGLGGLEIVGIDPAVAVDAGRGEVTLDRAVGRLVGSIGADLREPEWIGTRIVGGRLMIGDIGQVEDFEVIGLYDVRELIRHASEHMVMPTDVAERQLFFMVSDTIAPATWLQNGGVHSSGTPVADMLVIRTSRRNHERIERLLSGLEELELAQTGDRMARMVWAEGINGHERVQALLDRVVDVALIDVPIPEGVRAVCDGVGLAVVIDPTVFGRRGYGLDEEPRVSLAAAGITVGEALRELGERAGMGYDLPEMVLEVREGYLRVDLRGNHGDGIARLYDVRDLVERADGAVTEAGVEWLLEVIRSNASPYVWIRNGGLSGRATSFGGIAVVRAPWSVHVEVEKLLNELRRAVGLPDAVETDH